MSSNTLLGSMMLPYTAGDCKFQMKLQGLSEDNPDLILQLFATVAYETESDDPEWGVLDYGTACSDTFMNVSDGNSYEVPLKCGGTSVCLPWIYEAAIYEDDMHAVVLYDISSNVQSINQADWQTVAETLSHIEEAFPNTQWIGDASMYNASDQGHYSVLDWSRANGYLRMQSMDVAYSSHVLIFCTGPTANDITQYLNNTCKSLSFQTMFRSECIN